jgi:predicted phosphodiesterase
MNFFIMRRAIISDIHGNLEAFRRVLEDIDALGADETISLGDNVGYGPEPEGVVELLRERQIPSVVGNHEHGLVNPDRRNWFNFQARKALKVTQGLLSESSMDYLRGLPMSIEREGCLFVHGFPPDSAHAYLFAMDEAEIRCLFDNQDERFFFVGHTHMLELVTCSQGLVSRRDLGRETVSFETGARYIVNAGSVGQPRDHDPHAKYVIHDLEADSLEVRFVAYDIDRTARAIRALGVPDTYADRLYG